MKHNAAQVTMYSMMSAAVLSGVYALVIDVQRHSIAIMAILAFVNILAYSTVAMTRVDALKYINSTIYFPVYKIATSIAAIPISIFLFSDSITGKELIGILLGIVTALALITRKERARQEDFRKGAIFLGIGIAAVLFGISAAKTVSHLELDLSLYLFMTFLMGVFLARWRYNSTNGKEHSSKNVARIGLISGAFMFLNFLFFTKALSGDLAVVYVINSFSTVIAVLLSVAFYKEHFDLKKGFALLMMVASLILLK
ncbi:EamA family transporter [Candidatus Uhrbacteria bacterium]|jgi:drug/metabolite transporter (DMT)-like permease|nr:EamA family transporter [Candidatus Uhrbacteria bacterium]